MFNKTLFKFLGAGLVIAVLGFAVIYGLDHYRYRKSPEYQAQKYFEDLEKRYAEDTYGGNTPEETLQLFIDALKKGDIDLASKYFVFQAQDDWKKKLEDIQSRNVLGFMIEDLQQLQQSKIEDNRAFYVLADENNFVIVDALIIKNGKGQWKISEL